jgi:hypothetical protein
MLMVMPPAGRGTPPLKTSPLGAGRAADGIDANPLHPREVNDEPTVASGVAHNVVTATANGDEELVGAGEIDSANHVSHSGAADDHAGMLVDHGVKNGARGIVACVAVTEHLPT